MNSAVTNTIKVGMEDIDELGPVNNVVYVRYVPELATAHWHVNETSTNSRGCADSLRK